MYCHTSHSKEYQRKNVAVITINQGARKQSYVNGDDDDDEDSGRVAGPNDVIQMPARPPAFTLTHSGIQPGERQPGIDDGVRGVSIVHDMMAGDPNGRIIGLKKQSSVSSLLKRKRTHTASSRGSFRFGFGGEDGEGDGAINAGGERDRRSTHKFSNAIPAMFDYALGHNKKDKKGIHNDKDPMIDDNYNGKNAKWTVKDAVFTSDENNNNINKMIAIDENGGVNNGVNDNNNDNDDAYGYINKLAMTRDKNDVDATINGALKSLIKDNDELLDKTRGDNYNVDNHKNVIVNKKDIDENEKLEDWTVMDAGFTSDEKKKVGVNNANNINKNVTSNANANSNLNDKNNDGNVDPITDVLAKQLSTDSDYFMNTYTIGGDLVDDDDYDYNGTNDNYTSNINDKGTKLDNDDVNDDDDDLNVAMIEFETVGAVKDDTNNDNINDNINDKDIYDELQTTNANNKEDNQPNGDKKNDSQNNDAIQRDETGTWGDVDTSGFID